MRADVSATDIPLVVVGDPASPHATRWERHGRGFAELIWTDDLVRALDGVSNGGRSHALVTLDPEIVLGPAAPSQAERALRHAASSLDAWGILAAGGLDTTLRTLDNGLYLDRTTLPADPDLVPLALPSRQLLLIALESGSWSVAAGANPPEITIALAMMAAGEPAFVSPHLRFGRLERPEPEPSDPPQELPLLERDPTASEWRALVAAAGGHAAEEAPAVVDRLGLRERAAAVARSSRPDVRVTVVVRTALDRPGLLRRNLAALVEATGAGPLHEVLLVSSSPEVVEEAGRLAAQFDLPIRSIVTDPGSRPSRSVNLEAGARAASGDYVWFVDDDDHVEAGSLDAIQRLVHSRHHPLLVLSSRVLAERWDEAGSDAADASETGVYPGTDWFAAFHGSNRFPICAAVYPRTLLEGVDWELVTAHGLSEDYALFLDVAERSDYMRLTEEVAATISIRRSGEFADNVVTRTDEGWLEALVGVATAAFSDDGRDRVRMQLAAAASRWWLRARHQEGEMSGLRDHIEHLEDHAADLQREVWRLERAVERDSQARADLKWLLERLRRSPLGAVLRRRSGFKRLWERWGERDRS